MMRTHRDGREREAWWMGMGMGLWFSEGGEPQRKAREGKLRGVVMD